MGTYLSCARKYWHAKLGKTAPDEDIEEDAEALKVGKAFHACLENTRHMLTGYGYESCAAVCAEHGVDAANVPMIFAMLGRYRDMHERSGLHVAACEVVIDRPEFFGIVDAVMEETVGGPWWIVDMKTSGSYTPSLVPSLIRHPQLSLYSYYHDSLATGLELDPDLYQGVRYRLTTKSRLSKRKDEPLSDFINRLSSAVKAIDFAIPRRLLDERPIADLHSRVRAVITAHEDKTYYPQNYGECMKYFRPCIYWSSCYGRKYTDDLADIKVIEG
jgi:hypothetical protein